MPDSNRTQKALRAAEGYAELKMYDDALAELDRLLAEVPDHLDALYRKGLILLERGRWAEAEAPFCRIIELDPEQAHVYVHLAWIYRRIASLEKAIETIQRAIELKPSMPIALYNLACYRAVQGQSEQALTLLGKAIGLAKEYRALARSDPDFESVKGSEAFKKLTEIGTSGP